MLTALLAAALASPLIPVQGSLSDNAGQAVSGAQQVTFRLYADEAAASPLWTEVSGLVFDAGAFSHALGATQALDAAWFAQHEGLTLTVQLGDGLESQRQPLHPVPYAIHASNAGSLGGVAAGAFAQDTEVDAVRAALQSSIDQANALLAALDGDLDAEVTARTAAIAGETSARAAADSALQTNIGGEASARAAADTTLQGNINAETAARTSATSTLQSNINNEATARAAADGTLQGNINAASAALTTFQTTAASTYLPFTGGTITGNLTVNGWVDAIPGPGQFVEEVNFNHCTTPDNATRIHIRTSINADGPWDPKFIEVKGFHTYDGEVRHDFKAVVHTTASNVFKSVVVTNDGNSTPEFYRTTGTFGGARRVAFSVQKVGCCCVGRIWIKVYHGSGGRDTTASWAQTGQTATTPAW